MATKKYIELQEFSDADLNNELEETVAQYKKLKFDHSVKGLENPLELRLIRRDIARIKSEVRRREINAMDEAALSGRTAIQRSRRKK